MIQFMKERVHMFDVTFSIFKMIESLLVLLCCVQHVGSLDAVKAIVQRELNTSNHVRSSADM